MRTFEDVPAVRKRVPLLIGLVGPSGSGKTYSALRLATGIARVTGEPIFYIDTEAGRALHYADAFTFRHVPFAAPFGSLDYLAAIEHCVRKGAGVIIVDSMSHEHEGPGGVLEMHADELQRLAGDDYKRREKMKMLAWQKPKRERRQLLNRLLQLPANFIFCFRAKEKLKLVRGKDPEPQGWQPIAGEEFVYEMTVNALLLPGANGVPSWNPDEKGEKEMIKLPDFARAWFTDGRALDEDTGAKLAQWAAGTPVRALDEVLRDLAACSDAATLKGLRTEARAMWSGLTREDREQLTMELDGAAKRAKEQGQAA